MSVLFASSPTYKHDWERCRLKYFEHPELQQFRKSYLNPNFHHVLYIKPDSSRAASREGYWLCFGFKGVNGAHDEEMRGA